MLDMSNRAILTISSELFFGSFNTNCRGGAVVTDFRCAADVVRAPSIGKCTHLLLLGLGFFDEIIQYFPFRYLDFLQHALARTSLVVMHLAITLLLAALMELCWCMIKGSCR